MQGNGVGRASGPPGAVLLAEGVSKRFGGVKALDGVTFDVRAGEVHTLAGENGAVSTIIGQRRRTVRPRELHRVAGEVVSRIGVDLDLHAPVEELSVADRQLTAICRALAQEARIIF